MGGDQLARVALTVLVYARTASALLAAVTFVASVIPMFVGGLALGGLADRFPRRAVMIACDLLRCGLVLTMAVPGVPVAALVALLFTVTLVSAPFMAARSALVPDMLEGERFVLGQTVMLTSAQFTQVLGFGVGGVVAGFLGTRPSLLADAATYALSAVIVRVWVRHRGAPRRDRAMPGQGAGEAAGAGGGAAGTGGLWAAIRVVFGTRALRLPMFFGWLAAFYNAPEGVAAPLASHLRGGTVTVGVILAAQVLGETFGILVVGRLVPPDVRRRWMGPLAVASCAVLCLFATGPGLAAAVLVLAASGVFGGYQPAASAAFVSAVPDRMRGAAYGIALGGMSLGQGVLMIVAGAAADSHSPSEIIAVTGAVGALCAVLVAIGWVRRREDRGPVS